MAQNRAVSRQLSAVSRRKELMADGQPPQRNERSATVSALTGVLIFEP
jgi:hypothetical protein